MPELPEVETVRRGLAPYLDGAQCHGVTCRRGGLRYPFPHDINARLTGARVQDVGRRGKYLCLGFDNRLTMIVHLGMSGALRLHLPGERENADAAAGVHDHFLVHFADGAVMVLNDPRRFGMVYLTPSRELAQHPAFMGMGPEPLDQAFTPDILGARLRNHSAPIKNILLDQRVVAGLGNIYVCEALYEAGIHPRRPGNSLDAADCQALHAAIVNVLGRAIEAGGTSLRDHRRIDGTLGYFQHQFRVYQRADEVCGYCREANPDCDNRATGAIVYERLAGRATYYCPGHQK